jgi:hypothetical protein
MDDGDDHLPPRLDIAPKAEDKEADPLQNMNKSGQGPRRAIAEAIASPLGVQPSINNAVLLSSK